MSRLLTLCALTLALAACGSRPDVAPTALVQTRASTPPTVAVLGDGTGGGLLIVTFRGPQAVALSETAPAQILLGDVTLDAALDAGPATRPEGRDRTVTQATYRLDASSRVRLAKAGATARLVVTVGGERQEFPFVRADRLE